MGLSDRFKIKTNINKTVDMVFQPCLTSEIKYEVAHTQKITGEGLYYRARKWDRFR